MRLEEALAECLVAAILRGVTPEEVVPIAEALYAAGIRVAEIPLNSPRPLESIRRLAEAWGERMVCGANSSIERLSQGFDDGFVIDFVDASARDAYLAHPGHQRAGAGLVALLDGGLAGLVVFDLDDGHVELKHQAANC